MISRRQFFQVGVGLVVALHLPGCGTPSVPGQFNAFIILGLDGSVTLTVPSSEMGQGVHTSLAMILADELEVPWEGIKIVMAPLGEDYQNPISESQQTGSSTSVRGWYQPLRETAAGIRMLLVQAAASQWSVKAEKCRAEAGYVKGPHSSRLPYTQLISDAISQSELPDEPELKPPADFKLIGKSIRRVDLEAKVRGTAVYGIDVKLPGMLYASVAQAPIAGGKVARMDEAAARAVPGVRAVVPLEGGGVAVVADSTWRSRKGLLALSPTWSDGPHPDLDDALLAERLRDAVTQTGGKVREHRGDVGAAMKTAHSRLLLEYSCPLLAQAPMEPINCTAWVEKDRCRVWAPTQNQSAAQSAAAESSGLPPEKIELVTTYLGGGFGRRLEVDYVDQAVAISKAVKAPVQVLWSREEDMTHGFYRPATLCHIQVGLDEHGLPVAWDQKLAYTSRGYSEGAATAGATKLIYAVPNFRVMTVDVDVPFNIGNWRSVGHSTNAFFAESALDEVARAGRRDPVQLRRLLLKDEPRALAVLEAAVKAGGPKGFAMWTSFGTTVAQVVHLEVHDKQVKVRKVVCALDCGQVVNPDTVRAQMEGGICFGLTAAAMGRISLSRGAVVETNFHDYPLVTMTQMPEVEVIILESDEAPGGIGEPGVPPLAPALVSALQAATGGERLRSLPLTVHGYKLV